MREASTVACNERMISTICAMVMAAAPSAATGATGLERLLLIFLMKLDKSQNATDNTSFSDDQLSDQSVRPARNSSRNSETQKTSTETCNSTRNHRFFHGKPKEPKNSNLHRTKTRAVRRELHLTEQNLKRTVENVKTPNKTR